MVKLLVTGQAQSFPETGNRGAAGMIRWASRGRSQMSVNMSVSAGPMRTPDMVPAMPKRVMVVEDNELNMKLFNDLLETHGYNTLQMRDGRDVMGMTRKQRPDLILMDI